MKSNIDRHPRLDFQTATRSEKTPYSVVCFFFHSPTMRKHMCTTLRSAYNCCMPKPAGTPHCTYLSRGTLRVILQALGGHGTLSTLIDSLFALFRLLVTAVVTTRFWGVTVAFLCLRACGYGFMGKRFIGGRTHLSKYPELA